MPQKQLDNVYRALIESHLRYANVVWGSVRSSKIEILQNLLDRARAIIERIRIIDSRSYNWFNVEQLVRFDRSAMSYRIVNRMCPESLLDNSLRYPRIQTTIRETARTSKSQDTSLNMYKGFRYSYCVEQHPYQYQGTVNPFTVQNRFKIPYKELN